MQVPAPVDYERATSLDHAIQLLERHGAEARVIAGGHSLLPMMKLRLVQPQIVIDINDLTDLSFVKIDQNELVIGAMVRHAELLASPLVVEHFSIITEAEKVIADPIVRNRGTVGGSLCQADPSEDLSAVFSALKATLIVRGRYGTRTVNSRELHEGPYATVLSNAELLTEVRIPIRAGCGSAYEKVERRVGDWAIVAVGTVIYLKDGIFSDVGIGLTAVGSPHFDAPEAEQFLMGKEPSEHNLAEAARLASINCRPSTDQRGPEDYKRHLVEVLTARALRRSVEKASAGGIR